MALTMFSLLVLFPTSILATPSQPTDNLPKLLFHYCGGGNYTNDCRYEANLNHILSALPAGNGNGFGFYKLSYGDDIDTVHTIGQCRGDVKSDRCRECLHNVTQLLPKKCPQRKAAGGWYDECMVRYSDRSMAHGAAPGPTVFYAWSWKNASDLENFMHAVWDLSNDLKNRAASGGSLRKYATGNTSTPGFSNVYVLVQCTADRSQMDCNNCLYDSFSYALNLFYGKIGGKVIKSNCNFRYETGILFFDQVDDAPLYASPPPLPPPQTRPNPPPPPPRPNLQGNGGSRTAVNLVVVLSILVAVVLIINSICLLKTKIMLKKLKIQGRPSYTLAEEMESTELLHYSFEAIRVATDDFSEANKLGHGGFGPVYKGKLSNELDIAVKRLSRDSGQGDMEFKNELMLVAKLQHRNLVRLLGFCLQTSERLLVYEFVPNASLDQFIFDPSKRANLNWDMRCKIIRGVARGLLYLHEDSRLKIIHRDLKASNVLLDGEMNPQISDFGMARLFLVDQTHCSTSRVVGTYGYMAPEYVMQGQFSVKSDVFSFGVLLLEIVSGQKHNNFLSGDRVEDLLSTAWINWRNGTAWDIVDPLEREGPGSEIIRCIHIALLCVQKNVANRPAMSTVVLMLNADSFSLPLPSEPGFFMHSIRTDQASVIEDSISELYPR